MAPPEHGEVRVWGESKKDISNFYTAQQPLGIPQGAAGAPSRTVKFLDAVCGLVEPCRDGVRAQPRETIASGHTCGESGAGVAGVKFSDTGTADDGAGKEEPLSLQNRLKLHAV